MFYFILFAAMIMQVWHIQTHTHTQVRQWMNWKDVDKELATVVQNKYNM